MASLTLRLVKGSPLTNAEFDNNFSGLNADVLSRLLASSNLADLTNAGTARVNLGLGSVENKSSATIRSELTGLNVTTALGFTPYNATNPSGFISGINSSMVTTALGFTPYNSTNPSGYITSSALSSYLPLSGGTLTGNLLFGNASSPNTNYIQFGDNTGWVLRFMTNVSGTPTERFRFTDGGAFNTVGAITQNGSQVLHASNYSNYALPITGGTVSGVITSSISNGTVLNMAGQSDSFGYNGVSGLGTYIKGTGSTYIYGGGKFWDGSTAHTLLHAGNIGSYTAGAVSGLTLTNLNNGVNPNNVTQNQIGYNTSVSLFGQSDGGLYSSAYSSSWIHQIYGDFRTGQIATRGKNNGTWQAWRVQLDSGNYTSYAVPQSDVSTSGGGSVILKTASNGYLYVNNWINTGGGGLFSGVNSAHFYPNDNTYGAWKISGSRNGWQGLHFDSGSTLMINSATVGFHREGYGWQMRWDSGTGYIGKGNPGGGTDAAILDSSNYSSYALPLSGGTLTGSRPIQLDTSGGSVIIKGNTGGWGMGLYFKGSDDVIKGSFGALGGGSSFSYLWAGIDYSNNWIRFSSSEVNSLVALKQSGNQVLHAGNYSSYGITRTTGSPAYYGARAWVNFDGNFSVTQSPLIRASQNVSSITDNGIGLYRINFSTAMPDTYYSAAMSITGAHTGEASRVVVIRGSTTTGASEKSTTSLGILTGYGWANGAQDNAEVNVIIFR